MVTYIYFVKCPNCEDEHFDFFDEAKDFALGCLSQKPIITQTEVCRNDFGECTDHCDLGTVWSWEDVVGKEPQAEPITFAKDDIKADYDSDNDPEFQDDEDFRLINEELVESRRISFNNKADQQEFFRLCKETGMTTGADLDRFMQDYEADDSNLLDKLRAYKAELDNVDNDFGIEESCERKPVPEGMTIDQLKEAMEENEDTVECAGCEELFPKDECFHKEGIGWVCGDCEDRIVKCTWCDELYDKGECRYEVGFDDWLCGRCEAAIKSRGETLTFREGNYWDFLDEAVSLEDVPFDHVPGKFVVVDKPEDGGKWFTMFDINNGNPISYICAKNEDAAIDQIPYLVRGNIEDIAVEEVAEDELAETEIEEFLRGNNKKV